jgi:hypothetical protein
VELIIIKKTLLIVKQTAYLLGVLVLTTPFSTRAATDAELRRASEFTNQRCRAVVRTPYDAHFRIA